MSTNVAELQQVPLLAGERWFVPEGAEWGPVHNPSTGEPIARVPLCGPAEIEIVVQAARQAFGARSQPHCNATASRASCW